MESVKFSYLYGCNSCDHIEYKKIGVGVGGDFGNTIETCGIINDLVNEFTYLSKITICPKDYLCKKLIIKR